MIDGKLYYSISEVCQMTGLKDSVLRYWESEIPKMRPKQSKSSKKRMYTKKDIELIHRVKELIYEEKLSVADARAKIAEERAAKKTSVIKAVDADAKADDVNIMAAGPQAEDPQMELSLDPPKDRSAVSGSLPADILNGLKDILTILES